MALNHQRAVEKAVLLYALSRLRAQGRLKVQKGLFTAWYSLRLKGEPAPAYSFVRHHYGPYSQEVWNDCDDLVAKGLLYSTLPQPTERGRFVAEIAGRALTRRKANREAMADMDQCLEWCRKRTGEELKERIYQMRVVPDGLPDQTMRIADIPKGVLILDHPASTLEISASDTQVLAEQLAVTPAELAEAKKKSSETDRGAFNRLRAALIAAQPSG